MILLSVSKKYRPMVSLNGRTWSVVAVEIRFTKWMFVYYLYNDGSCYMLINVCLVLP